MSSPPHVYLAGIVPSWLKAVELAISGEEEARKASSSPRLVC